MQVKRRINQFFGNIRRRDNKSADEESATEEDFSPNVSGGRKASKKKGKWKTRKHSQNYSQWDLMQNIADDPVHEDSQQQQPIVANVSGLNEGCNNLYAIDKVENDRNNLVETEETDDFQRKKSFLQRSGSLLRRSIRRSKKSKQTPQDHDYPKENLEDIVSEMNKTIAEVANFGGESFAVGGESNNPSSLDDSDSPYDIAVVDVQLQFKSIENDEEEDEQNTAQNEDHETKPKKFTFRKGLQRQASKLVSKFRRNPGGSLRLKSSTSIDSFPSCVLPQKARSSSLCEIPPPSASGSVEIAEEAEEKLKNTGSFRRRLSFKKARKAVRKGVTTLGKNMVHASAVMPVSYECPPPTLYPDYEANYPSELEQYYYRTVSYQPKRWDDERNLDYCRRPASYYYQHGFVYN